MTDLTSFSSFFETLTIDLHTSYANRVRRVVVDCDATPYVEFCGSTIISRRNEKTTILDRDLKRGVCGVRVLISTFCNTYDCGLY